MPHAQQKRCARWVAPQVTAQGLQEESFPLVVTCNTMKQPNQQPPIRQLATGVMLQQVTRFKSVQTWARLDACVTAKNVSRFQSLGCNHQRRRNSSSASSESDICSVLSCYTPSRMQVARQVSLRACRMCSQQGFLQVLRSRALQRLSYVIGHMHQDPQCASSLCTVASTKPCPQGHK